MSEVVAYVTGIEEKSGVSKQGKPYTVYNVYGRTKDGEELRIGWGFNAPTFKEGIWLKATVSQDGKYLNYKGGSFQVADGAEPAVSESAQRSATGAGRSNAGAGRNEYWENKEKRDVEVTQPRIQYQSARKDAIQVVASLVALDALPISKASSKAGEAKRYEQVMEIIDKITVRFYEDTESLRRLETVADEYTEPSAHGDIPDVPETDDAFADDIPF